MLPWSPSRLADLVSLREEAKPGGFAYLTRLNEVVVSVLFRNLTIWRTHDLPLSEKDKPNNALR